MSGQAVMASADGECGLQFMCRDQTTLGKLVGVEANAVVGQARLPRCARDEDIRL